MKIRNALYIIAGLIVLFALIKQCEGEPRVITKTETVIKWKKDTVKIKEIVKVDKPIYIEKVKTVKGKDSIIYKDKPSETTIEAEVYETKLKSNDATADLNIVSTGEVLDVTGTITYPEKETTTTITKIKDKSGFYLYGKAPISAGSFSPEIGVQYNIKNKMFISTGIQYNNLDNNLSINAGIGINLF